MMKISENKPLHFEVFPSIFKFKPTLKKKQTLKKKNIVPARGPKQGEKIMCYNVVDDVNVVVDDDDNVDDDDDDDNDDNGSDSDNDGDGDGEDRSQDREAHFVRACAVEMHMDISQEALVRKFTGKMPDANPGASILCEPAQSKCTWTFHKRHFVQKFTGDMADPYPGAKHFVRACAIEMHMDMSEEAFCAKFTGEMADPYPGASILCEPAQSKCTWTCHKRPFVRKLTGKMADASDTTSIEHQVLTPTVSEPLSVDTLFGEWQRTKHAACRMPVHWAVRPVRLLSPNWTPTPGCEKCGTRWVQTGLHMGCHY